MLGEASVLAERGPNPQCREGSVGVYLCAALFVASATPDSVSVSLSLPPPASFNVFIPLFCFVFLSPSFPASPHPAFLLVFLL